MKNVVIVILASILISGCLSQYVEYRAGLPYKVVVRRVCGVEVSRSESKVLTTGEKAKVRKSEAMSALVPRGGWMLTIGLVAGAAGIAVGLIATAKLYQSIAGAVAACGGVLAASGLVLMGIGLIGAGLAVGAVVLIGIGCIVYFKDHKFAKG